MLDLTAGEIIARLDLVGAAPFFLCGGDEMLQLALRKALVVDVVRAIKPLDERELILRVHDLEELRQIGFAMMNAQQAVAQSVKSADPHAAGIERRHRSEPA